MSCADSTPAPATPVTPATTDLTGYVKTGPHKWLTTACLNLRYDLGFCDSDKHAHNFTIGDTIIFIVKESEVIEHVYMDSITKAYNQDTAENTDTTTSNHW
jgi:hypothetical protein